MIGLPLILWLVFTSFDFGNSDQLFAILGVVGFATNFTKYGKLRIGKMICFFLMILPIIRRLKEIEIEKFNYPTFQIPFLIFVLTYLTYIIITEKKLK